MRRRIDDGRQLDHQVADPDDVQVLAGQHRPGDAGLGEDPGRPGPAGRRLVGCTGLVRHLRVLIDAFGAMTVTGFSQFRRSR